MSIQANERVTIKTPQFKNGKVRHMKQQTGVLDQNLLFIPDTLLEGGHKVQFQSYSEFLKAEVK